MIAAQRALNIRLFDPVDGLERSAAIYRERIAVIDGDIRRTYPQMLERVYRFANALRELGVRPGDRVAVLAKNQSPLLEAHFAVPLAGAVLCALNTRLVAEEIAYIVSHCGASVIILDEEFLPAIAGVDAAVRRIVIGGTSGAHEFEGWIASASAQRPPSQLEGEDATISINYTSGTTGRPKGVMYTYRGAYINAMTEIFHANIRPESVYLWTLPMFHCNGWCFPWAVTLAGATHVALPKVDPAAIFALIEREGVTHFCGAPTVLIALANHPGAQPFSKPVHVTTAGAPPAPTTISQMEALGASITAVYGLTETYGPITVCAWQTQWDALPAGERAKYKARQGVGMIDCGEGDIRVVESLDPDEDPEAAVLVDVPRDGKTQGEIVMRGNNVMKGYYADPAATRRAFAGGWFHSGDIAVLHEDGYIEIQDRAKDVIISGGENISTIQVEKTILEMPGVLECAVIAKPDAKWGEVPKAFVTPKAGITLREEDVIAYCRTKLPGFKVPKAVEFGDLPKTSTGKIQKYVLREREWAGREKRVN